MVYTCRNRPFLEARQCGVKGLEKAGQVEMVNGK